ncbi:vesicle-trafficking protein SEC22c [Nerophis ophidion]|uniref:vesicle-trafficking protein SEC22c n=1 Tax=Nerophis ophidion TaxID=159077 RepID=UPI002AE0138E|nr:vesicle-trafficking protein SEC22c [Nerophis ophidion]XP_061778418.1 vesicle-trafficking protein SEC22c [Nerophis ophidion]
MSLILFVLVVRVRDGLPLSASTDFEHNVELQERKQQLRTISRTLAAFPERTSMKGQELDIHLLSWEGVSYMSVCHCSMSLAKVFCFLEDLRWEFSACYKPNLVALATRPYPFLHFDDIIQKLKQQYEQKGGPALQVTLTEVQEDLRLRPPQIVSLEEVALTNGAANGHAEQLQSSGQCTKLEAVTAPGILALVLNIMCASLNLIRAVHLLEHTFQDDQDNVWNVAAFLLAFVCGAVQCHLYLFHSRHKTAKSAVLLSAVVACNLFLLGLRNAWQVAFHVGVASLATVLIATRRVRRDRSHDCGV